MRLEPACFSLTILFRDMSHLAGAAAFAIHDDGHSTHAAPRGYTADEFVKLERNLVRVDEKTLKDNLDTVSLDSFSLSKSTQKGMHCSCVRARERVSWVSARRNRL